MLYVISTPIGNLKDISLRAIETLDSADLIVAEDTRTAGKLLKHLEIGKKPFLSFNDHNHYKRIPGIVKALVEGRQVALISERGTPCVSDPGYRLVKAAIAHSIQVVPVPGASAAMAALVVSGLPTDSFYFAGFLPKKPGKLKSLLQAHADTTLVCYESPHRIAKTLKLLAELVPEWQLAICRELTKLHESVLRGNCRSLAESQKLPKGEFTLVLSGKAFK